MTAMSDFLSDPTNASEGEEARAFQAGAASLPGSLPKKLSGERLAGVRPPPEVDPRQDIAPGRQKLAEPPPPRRINPWRMFTGAMVPNWLLSRPEISHGAKLTYARLAQHAGKEGRCFPKQDTLADELGTSERSVRDYLRELAKARLVKMVRRGLAKSNLYFFLDHPWIQDSTPNPTASGQDRQNLAGLEKQSSAGPTVEENPLRDSSATHNGRVQPLPRTEEEALKVARQLGVPEPFAFALFKRMVAVEWLDGCHRRVCDWQAYLAARWADDQRQRPGRQPTAKRCSSPGPPRTFGQANYNQSTDRF